MAKDAPKPPKDILLIVMVVACVVAVAVMIVVLCLPQKGEQPTFVPPPFEVNAVVGVPEVEEDRGYSELYQKGMAYRVGLCGHVYIVGNSAEVYLTNSAENNVWLKLRVLDANGNVLGETGLVKPGEYVKAVALQSPVLQNGSISLKVMGYEPETYYSVGSIQLNPMVTVKQEP